MWCFALLQVLLPSHWNRTPQNSLLAVHVSVETTGQLRLASTSLCWSIYLFSLRWSLRRHWRQTAQGWSCSNHGGRRRGTRSCSCQAADGLVCGRALRVMIRGSPGRETKANALQRRVEGEGGDGRALDDGHGDRWGERSKHDLLTDCFISSRLGMPVNLPMSATAFYQFIKQVIILILVAQIS